MSLRHGVPKNLPLVVRLPVCHGSQVTNQKSLTPLECAFTRRPQPIETTAALTPLESAFTQSRSITPLECAFTKKQGGGGCWLSLRTSTVSVPLRYFFPQDLSTFNSSASHRPSNRPDGIGAANQERDEAKCEHGMAEAGAEVLPEGRAGSGIVGGKKQREHENQAANAGGPHQNAEDQRDADSELSVSHKKSDGRGVREHKPAKHRRHKWISAAFEKSIDPILKAAVKREL